VARSKIQTYSLLALAMFLFVGLAWSLDLTAFNMWVAGGPPAQAQEIYAHLGKVFLAVSIGFLLAFLLVLWTLIRNRKHQVP
jgi:TRAP-type C4-dicarboxylate transport system permease small subunit